MPPDPEDAVILCGGAATRLRGVLDDRPKSMAIVRGKPFLEWLILFLARNGVRRAVLATGYMAEQIQRHFDGGRFGVEIGFSHEDRPMGTGGALRLAIDHVESDNVLVLNGDTYCRFDLNRLRKRHGEAAAAATLWLVNASDTGRFGSVEVLADGRITAFNEKQAGRRGPINGGVYLMGREIVEAIPQAKPMSLESDVFPKLVGHGLYGVVGAGIFVDIGTPESLQGAETALELELDRLEATA
jgi:NDP-sugar pyrophosphorylase family protein